MPHIPGIFLLLQRDYPIKRIVLNFKRNFFEEMQTLNLPQAAVKITEKAGKRFIFDPIRKKYVALTPEEWVRQHFVHYLVEHKGYPQGLVANEISLNLNGTSRETTPLSATLNTTVSHSLPWEAWTVMTQSL